MTDYGLKAEFARANKNARKVLNAAINSVDKSVQESVELGRNHILELISKPGQGKNYTYSYGPHAASAPGDPPAARIGGPLYKSIVARMNEKNKSLDGIMVSGYFGSEVKYAVYLEYGWRRGKSVGQPRPFFRPTAEWIKPHVTRITAKNWIKSRNAALRKLQSSGSMTASDSVSRIGKIS